MSTKERPILFKGEMVGAILDGSKTQTRRAVKPQSAILTDEMARGLGVQPPATENPAVTTCPYGNPGDRLWVRETFCIESSRGLDYDPPHCDGRPIRHHQDDEWGPWWEQPHYLATDPAPEFIISTDEPGCRWRKLIFMPRWASRILLEITAVRVERLQSISEKDARAEGCPKQSSDFPVGWYHALWDDINGWGSWAANPWVWVVEFRRVQP